MIQRLDGIRPFSQPDLKLKVDSVIDKLFDIHCGLPSGWDFVFSVDDCVGFPLSDQNRRPHDICVFPVERLRVGSIAGNKPHTQDPIRKRGNWQ
jgi:hypothetical protein